MLVPSCAKPPRIMHTTFDGIDVSHHQGNIDWTTVKKSKPGLSFVYIKSSEGKTYVDPKFKTNAEKASAQGYMVGAYHYFRMTSSPEDQFRNFKKQMDKVHLDLVPMVDVEQNDKKSRAEIQKNLKIFLDLLEKAYGKKPMIYGTNSFYNKYCAPEFNDYTLYIGKFGAGRPVVTGPSHYAIWQFSERGRIKGIPNAVDICRFHPENGIKDLLLNK